MNELEIKSIKEILFTQFKKEVKQFHNKEQVTLFSCLTFCNQICHQYQKEFDNGNPNLVEYGIRDAIYSLENILKVLNYQPAQKNKISFFEKFQIPDALISKLHDLFLNSSILTMLNDSFDCFFKKGFHVEIISKKHIKFVDVENWRGVRDYAQVKMSQHIKLKRAKQTQTTNPAVLFENFKNNLDIPLDLMIDKISVAEFLDCWSKLMESFVPSYKTGDIILETNKSIFNTIKELTGFSESKINCVQNLFRYNHYSPTPYPLIASPIVPFSQNESFILYTSLIFSRLDVLISKYMIYKTNSFDKNSNAIEKHMSKKFKGHFENDQQKILTNRKFHLNGVKRDIDVMLYDSKHRTIYIMQSKYFVLPDSTNEVFNANKSLKKAIEQMEQTKAWVEQSGKEQILSWFEVTNKKGYVFEYVIMGNGFSGSDYLDKIEKFPIIDFQYTILNEYYKSPFIKVLKKFNSKFKEYMKSFNLKNEIKEYNLYGYKFEIPLSIA